MKLESLNDSHPRAKGLDSAEKQIVKALPKMKVLRRENKTRRSRGAEEKR